MKRFITLVNILIIIFGIATFAGATLIDRGGGLIYDDDLDITWLQDANYAKTSGYDTDGSMTWEDANIWANALVYGEFEDWRLPLTLQPDPVCTGQNSFPSSYGYNCTGSEMGHLYYTELGNSAHGPLLNIGPFINVQGSFRYWSETELAPDPRFAWFFEFRDGRLDASSKGVDYGNVYAWAVRDGDVTSIPEPATILLLGSGLLGLVAYRVRYKLTFFNYRHRLSIIEE